MSKEDKFDEIVSSALEKQTDFELPRGFADRVLFMIQQRQAQRESKRDRWWLIAGIVAIVATLAYIFTKVQVTSKVFNEKVFTEKFTPGVGIYTFFSGYSGLVLFGLAFIIALHILDKRVLRQR